MNIFEMAKNNSENLEQSFCCFEDKCIIANDINELNKFINIMKNDWKISINLRQFALNNLLIAGKYNNIYDIKKDQENELMKKDIELESSIDEALKSYLKNHYKSRMFFDKTFEKSETFKYGALNIGGLGPTKYGEYCVLIGQEYSKQYLFLVFIKKDSLNYVDENTLNIMQLSQDIADRDHVHLLAVLKHENDFQEIHENELRSVICCDESYIEAIISDEILKEHIKSVRISKEDYHLYYDYLYKDFISELNDEEKHRLGDFRNMQILLDQLKIKLEVVEENEN